MKEFILPIMLAQTLLLLLLSVNIYYEFTNPKKINDWKVAISNEKLTGLTAEKAFLKLSKYGFSVIENSITPDNYNRIIIDAPYQVGIIGLFPALADNPFSYGITIDARGIVVGSGWNK